jgi:hypothetical protein
LKGARLTANGSEVPTEVNVNGATTGATAFRENDLFMQTAEVTGGSGNAASVEAKVEAIHGALADASARLDDNDVPDEGRYCILRPQEYRQLAKAVQSSGFSLTNTDYGTSGSVAGGKVFSVQGFDIIRSTQLPKTDVGSTGKHQFHGGDYTQTVALIGQNSAIGIGKLIDLTVDAAWDPRRRGTLYLAEMAAAFKYIRPESLIELVISTGSIV